MNKPEAKQNIQKLIDKYNKVVQSGKLKQYNEAQTRNEFIEPMFGYLGWDMRNINIDNEVTTEEKISRDRVDLAFRINGIPVMYLEAKSLKVDLNIEQYSRQAINYAWNKGVAYAILTDFESIKLYNVEAESKRLIDKLIFEISHTDYITDFGRLQLLSKESFLKGALDEYAQKYGKMKKRLTVNEKLFRDLRDIREILTKAFSQWNKKLTKETLEEGIQRIIDRLFFIRVLEDRHLEPPLLKEVLRKWQKNTGQQFFPLLAYKFRELDDHYNSSIFEKHACDQWEEYSGDFKKVVSLLYGDDELNTYDFKEIPADILGGVYESYLGYIAESKKTGKQKAKQKTERKRKEQGIFYTPHYIVNYLVEQTLGKKLNDCKTVHDLKQVRVLDPACGSGAFLVKALQTINNKYKEFGNPGNQFTKGEILLTNIYGVDLDSQAIELAKLNLLIEALDQKAMLPDITPHICEGNSLVSGNAEKLEQYFGKEWREQKPFDFQEVFSEVFPRNKAEVILLPYHITWVTHNSRVSERMVQFGVERGEPVVLSGDDEIEITKYILQIVQEEKLRILNYNICRDHVHMLLICDESKRDNIVRKLKGKSTQLYKQNHGLKEEFHLWAQKYSCTFIESDKQMANTMEYIQHNREKHKLPRNKGLQPIVASMITPFADAFAPTSQPGGFDVIIGNPPYVFARGGNFSESVKKYYYDNFSLASYQLNTYLLFIDRAFKLLKDDGYFGFIIPNTWLTIDTFSGLRKFLLESTANLQIINIYDKVFQDANVDTCLLLFQKGKPSKVTLGEFRDGKLEIISKSPISLFKSNNYIINIALTKNKDKMEIMQKIDDNSKMLGKFCDVKSGFVAYEVGRGKPTQTDEMKNNRIYHSNKREGEGWYKYLDGQDVKRYQVDWSGMWVKYGEWLAAPRTADLYKNKRILVRQIPSQPPYSINAVFADENMLMNDRNSMIILKFNKIDPLFVLAVLNSKITTFWFVNKFDKFQRKTFPQFKVKELAIFPIPITSKAEQEKIAKMAQEMLDLNKKLKEATPDTNQYGKIKQEIEKADKEIDKKIYDLYGLTEEEIKIIEESKT